MAYYIYLFSPETFDAFSSSDRAMAGVRTKQKGIASKVRPGDKLVCYVTKLSRWTGVLEVLSNYFINDSPIFMASNDPFTIRFSVESKVWLPLEESIPVHNDICWDHLSFTKELPKRSLRWTPMVRTSLRRLHDDDGDYLERILLKQMNSPVAFAFTEDDHKKLKNQR